MSRPSSPGETRWIDGLRGVASFLVVNAHIARSFAPFLLSPVSEDGSSLVWQQPIIRNMFMGRASIAIFAIVSGYVNGLKATRLTREGQHDLALIAVSKTAFRRTFRFILPMMVATCMIWFLCQIGVFKLGEVVEWAWIRDTSPKQSETVIDAVQDLLWNLGKTWVDGANEYDPVQWTLTYLLRASMLVYLTLVATAFVKPKHRYAMYMIMYGYYFWMGDAVIGINIYVGLFLAELSNDPTVSSHMAKPNLALICAGLISVFVGLFCISYPEINPESANWSRNLLAVGQWIFPAGAEFSRFWPAIGSQLIVAGTFFIPQLKYMLSWGPLCWMGKVSFAIYLIHGTMMRSILTYLVFGWSERPEPQYNDETNEWYLMAWVPEYSKLMTTIAILLFYPILYRAAGWWVKWVDPACGRAAKWAEGWLFVEGESSEKNVAPSLPS